MGGRSSTAAASGAALANPIGLAVVAVIDLVHLFEKQNMET